VSGENVRIGIEKTVPQEGENTGICLPEVGSGRLGRFRVAAAFVTSLATGYRALCDWGDPGFNRASRRGLSWRYPADTSSVLSVPSGS
jgi:hypothetical protein